MLVMTKSSFSGFVGTVRTTVNSEKTSSSLELRHCIGGWAVNHVRWEGSKDGLVGL